MPGDQLRAAVEVRQMCLDGTAKTIRVKAGVTLAEVAKPLDTTPTAVWRWESGLRVPRGERAVRYHRVLRQLQSLTAGETS